MTIDHKDVLARLIAATEDYAIFLLNGQGTILTWNEGARRTIGYETEQVVGQPFSILYPPEERRLADDALETACRTGLFKAPARFMRQNGEHFWVHVSVNALSDGANKVTVCAVIARSMMHERGTEEARQHEEEKFNLLMTGVQEYAIFMMDPEGRITEWNSAAERLLGYSRDEVLGHSFSLFFTPQEGEPGGVADRELKLAVSAGRATDDRWHVRKDGTHFWASGITSALRDEQGSLRGFAKVLRDSTDRKRFEEELRDKAHALEEADRRKDEFLAMLAHELRNPLAPVATAVTLLQKNTPVRESDQEALAVLERQVGKLTRLIDDLMDVSRITRGKIQLNRTRIDLRNVLEGAVGTALPLIEEQRHTLRILLPDEPLWVLGDATRLEQVFENLLNNAAKYTPTGGEISLSAERAEGCAVVRVRDNGVGIPPELVPNIFDLFTQADRSLDRSQGGLGIGLTIVSNLVEMHEGTVEVTTDGLDKGSEFIVRLPLHVESSGEPLHAINPHGAASEITQKTFLVVDDNADAAKMLAALLRANGHKVEIALCGNQALEMVEKYKPRVILLDIGLPGLDGYQLARRFRESETTKDIVLVAITGYGTPEARQRSKDAGFNYHLVKPVQFADIDAVIAMVDKSTA